MCRRGVGRREREVTGSAFGDGETCLRIGDWGFMVVVCLFRTDGAETSGLGRQEEDVFGAAKGDGGLVN